MEIGGGISSLINSHVAPLRFVLDGYGQSLD